MKTIQFIPRRIGFVPRLAGIAGFLLAATTIQAVTTNYSTGFETAEGYVNGPGLAGQQEWVGLVVAGDLSTNAAGSAGNGIITGGLGGSGQAAYVGLTPLSPPYDNYVDVFQPVSLDPVGSGLSTVKFATKLKIVDSTNSHYDYFAWEFYNSAGSFLFGIEFDNDYLEVNWYDSTNGYGFLAGYSDGVEYALAVTMDFASNRYSATLNGILLTNALPITVDGSLLDLTAVSAIWEPQDPAAPGNNYMIFDDYLVTSQTPQPQRPVLRVVTPGGSSAATIRLTGEDGYQFALDASTNLVTWRPVGTNSVSGGTADYPDAAALGKAVRFYRARWVP